uniref:Kelch-like family member 4 n=1 Tax=Hucho hucho TaxID=62062 RepID=A0A4W5PLP2_9TELE
MSGKKEFDMKQILRLRWRWFSHSSQSSAGGGGGGGGGGGVGCLQESFDHRGTPVQGRLKNHSRDRGGSGGGLRKQNNNSPVHSILAPMPVYVRASNQSWQQQNIIQHLQQQGGHELPKNSNSPNNTRKEDCSKSSQENVKSVEESLEAEARDRRLYFPKGKCYSTLFLFTVHYSRSSPYMSELTNTKSLLLFQIGEGLN